jgi:hypothetical protein
LISGLFYAFTVFPDANKYFYYFLQLKVWFSLPSLLK